MQKKQQIKQWSYQNSRQISLQNCTAPPPEPMVQALQHPLGRRSQIRRGRLCNVRTASSPHSSVRDA
ncbi:hypothetical protein CEXT_486381 [Caerostris extrusa]|uniref:Uncharacterized protein n=1 Tax=Caerostris extrusa TaxID=172846 RepID=A0AAV4RE01_CAEEX|nr:hypothetical protein CEXT_486381 [Caerostris extrusa]